jgi:tetratricopeptide (TPR) repeat protein
VTARPVACAAVAALVCAGLTSWGCGNSHIKSQRRDLSRVTPVELAAPTKYEGDVRTARVRVWADSDHRGQSARWRRRIADEIDYANQLLVPMLGLRLEITEIGPWDRHEPGAPLRETLTDLAAHDDGDGVHFVIGLTSALSMVSTDQHELGMAEVLSKYIVLRGFSDIEERKAFERRYPDIEAEREEVLDARRRHKQTVVLLHEIGHSLGAIHEQEQGWIMHPSYEAEQSSISDRNREIMLIAAAERVKPEPAQDLLAMQEKILSAVEASNWGGWVAVERDELVALLRSHIEAAKAGSAAPPVPQAISGQYRRAEQLLAQNKPRDAWTELEPLLAAYPGNATIRLLACRVRIGEHGPAHAETTKVCDRAIELAPGDPAPYIVLAAALYKNKDATAARKRLAEASERVGNLGEAAPAAWLEIASAHQAMGDISRAEQALARAGVADHPIKIWATRLRARYGVPPDGKKFKLSPDDEWAYVAAVRGILDLTYANKLGEAATAARKAEARWPRAPGILAARCDLAFRQGRAGEAQGHCKAAIAAYPGTAWAHYLLGVLILRGANTKAGIESLQRAIATDPDLAQAWRALGKAYERSGDKAALEQLRRDYLGRFQQALP